MTFAEWWKANTGRGIGKWFCREAFDAGHAAGLTEGREAGMREALTDGERNELENLRRLALNASGPWRSMRDVIDADADYIEAAQPSQMLRLLALIERLSADAIARARSRNIVLKEKP